MKNQKDIEQEIKKYEENLEQKKYNVKILEDQIELFDKRIDRGDRYLESEVKELREKIEAINLSIDQDEKELNTLKRILKIKRTEAKYIMSIDPGTEESGYVLYDVENDYLQEKGIIPNTELIEKVAMVPDVVFIEMIASYGMPVGKDVFETCLWVGRFIQEFQSGILGKEKAKCMLLYRPDIKIFICNNKQAKDSNIRQALIDIYGKPGTKKNPNRFYNDSKVKMATHIWSALAVHELGQFHLKNNTTKWVQ